MLHVKDERDDLFRKAAEEYPLHIGSGDWDALHKKMSEGSPEAGEEIIYKKRNGFFFLLPIVLLLLSPLYIIEEFFSNSKYSKGVPNESGVLPVIVINDQSTSIVPPSFQPAEATSTSGGQYSQPLSHPGISLKSIGLAPSISHESFSAGKDKNRKGKQRMVATIESANTQVQDETVEPVEGLQEQSVVLKPETILKNDSEKEKKTGKKDSLSTSNEKKKIKGSKQRYFYAGILGGLDVSTIKMQAIKKIGFSSGLIVGYQFNKHWGVESGLLWDKKYYDTDGKYFNTKNISLPNYAEILHASGNCQMYEIPLSVRYSFATKNRSSWFAAAGISSYIMKKEEYNYDVKRYTYTYPRYAEYKNSSSDLFAVMSVSAGYKRQLGKIATLRIEPYLKLPINKVGIGNMPLQSAGINFGLTRSF